jgi:hypothetical protein
VPLVLYKVNGVEQVENGLLSCQSRSTQTAGGVRGSSLLRTKPIRSHDAIHIDPFRNNETAVFPLRPSVEITPERPA